MYDKKHEPMIDFLLNDINIFTKIALENLELARAQHLQANSAKSVNEHTNYIMQSRRYAIVSIVFSAFTLEAYINNYAARKGLEKHLDGLSFMNKWIEIPRLATGKEFQKNHKCYQDLDELKKLRNKLVHSKTMKLQEDDEIKVKQVGNDAYLFIHSAEKAVNTIFAVVKCLVELDSDERQYLSEGTTAKL